MSSATTRSRQSSAGRTNSSRRRASLSRVWRRARALSYNPPPVPVTIVDNLGGGGSGSGAPAEQQLEEVNPEEVKDLQEVNVEQTLQAITDAV